MPAVSSALPVPPGVVMHACCASEGAAPLPELHVAHRISMRGCSSMRGCACRQHVVPERKARYAEDLSRLGRPLQRTVLVDDKPQNAGSIWDPAAAQPGAGRALLGRCRRHVRCIFLPWPCAHIGALFKMRAPLVRCTSGPVPWPAHAQHTLSFPEGAGRELHVVSLILHMPLVYSCDSRRDLCGLTLLHRPCRHLLCMCCMTCRRKLLRKMLPLLERLASASDVRPVLAEAFSKKFLK